MKKQYNPGMLVMFDCDGVLVDSEGISRQVLVEQVARFGLDLDPAVTARQFAGRRLTECVADVERWLGKALPRNFMFELRQAEYQALADNVTAVPGAPELVTWLVNDRRFEICVASNGPREKIHCTLGTVGMRELFQDRIFSAYDDNIYKPDPSLYRRAASALGTDATAALVIEDSRPGAMAGVDAGSRVLVFAPQDDRSGFAVSPRLQFFDDMLKAPQLIEQLWRDSAETG